jgi:DNA sulfur modification protein DndB
MTTEPLPGEALRDALLPVKNLAGETRKRLSPYLYKTVSPKLIGDMERGGWILDRRNKSSVRMRKPKPHDVAFEDRVWAAFAKLSFTSMNRDRTFRLAYGAGSSQSKQIDVFAADDEVVLIIECKSASTLRTHQFKEEAEAIQGTRTGIIQAIKKGFPQHKVKFVLATNNFGLSKPTVERIEHSGIIHMDEDVIDYYLDLAEHLGKAARFQLLGALFAGTKIPELEPTVAAIQSRMGGHRYYSFAIEPERLLKMAYVLHRNRANSALMPTYQRLIKKTRLKRVAQFVDEGGFFPNSIILNIESGKRDLRFESVGKIEGEAKLGILHLPKTYRAAYVIDGQHRLYGYADSKRAGQDLIPVVAFVDLPRSEQVRLFMQINENQQAVPKNLRNTLNAELLWDSDDLREQMRAMKLRIAQHLGENKRSPLHGRVIIGENKRTLTRCITIDAVSRGLDRSRFLGTHTKTEVRRIGTLFRGSNDSTFDFTTDFLELCFAHIREGLESQWALGSAPGGFVFVNNGIEGILRVLSDIVDHLIDSSGLDVLSVQPDAVFADCVHYLDPLVEYLLGLDADEASGFKGLYGAGGGTQYWRRFQLAIRAERQDFNPAGLDEYVASEERAYNTEAMEIVHELEACIKADLRERLELEHGANWYKKGIPRSVRLSAAEVAIKRNLDLDPEEELQDWDCLYLIEYRDILNQNHEVWTRLFAKRYTRPGEEDKSGSWKLRTDWFQRLNDLRNDLMHNRSVAEDDHEFLVALRTWLVLGQAENDL